MSPIRVLVVDDEKLLVKSTCMALRYMGFEAVGASDGLSGLHDAEEHLPDVILLDIMMPGLCGWDVLKRLKGNERTRDIPVIVFTAKEYSDGRKMAQARGAADYLPKPFDLEELQAAIRRYGRPDEVHDE